MSEPILSFKDLVKFPPYKQFILVVGLAILFLLTANWWSSNPEIHWMISTTSVGFYLWLNTFIFFFIKERSKRYILISLLFFILVNVTLTFIAEQLSTLSIKDLVVYQSIISATTIFFFLAYVVTLIGKSISKVFGMNEELN